MITEIITKLATNDPVMRWTCIITILGIIIMLAIVSYQCSGRGKRK